RAVEAERHRAENVAHRGAALELAPGEVGRADRELQVVPEVRSRFAIALAALAMTLEALGLLVEILTARDQRGRRLRRIGDHGGRLRFLLFPASRQRLDVGDDRQPLLVR